MEEKNGIAAAKLAGEISTIAKEAADTCKTRHPTMKDMQPNLSCFADAFQLLSLQLSDTSMSASFFTKDISERFWPNLRPLLELWLKTAQRSLADLRGERSLWQGFTVCFGELVSEKLAFVKVATETHMEEAQVLIALLNLQSVLRHDVKSDGRLNVEFLIRDLEWKAVKVKTRIDRTREAHKLDPDWSRAQYNMAGIAMEAAAHARTLIESSNKAP